MEIRPIEAGDSPALSHFFERIPESDRTFLKEDVGDPRVLIGAVVCTAAGLLTLIKLVLFGESED